MIANIKTRIALVLLFLASSMGSYAQQDSLKGRQFIELQHNGKFLEALELTDDSFRQKVNAATLNQIWNSLEHQFGTYQGIKEMKALRNDSLSILYMDTDFKKAFVVLQVNLNQDHDIIGFFAVKHKTKEDAGPLPGEVSIDTKGGKLYGTLNLPKSDRGLQIALIIAGSGPTDRNGNNPLLQENNMYKMLADSLSAYGIASLRYDKRGVGKSSEFRMMEKVSFEDYVNDAVAWLQYLKNKPGFTEYIIIGHSEGSLIGMLATQQTDIDGFVSIAGPADSIGNILEKQLKGIPGIGKKLDSLKYGRVVTDVPQGLESIFASANHNFMGSWMQYYPVTEISRLTVPVMIINGTADRQVPTEEAQKLAAACKRAELHIIRGMNHLMKNASSGEGILPNNNSLGPVNSELVNVIKNFIDKIH